MKRIAAIPRVIWLPGALLAPLMVSAAFGADLTLFANDDYQGRALGVVIDERQLGVLNFDDRASSAVVEKGTWVLCSDEDFGGQCVTLGPGRYTSLQAIGLNNAITSVRRRDPVSVGEFKGADAIAQTAASGPGDIQLYASDDYRGAPHSVDQQQADLPMESVQGKATSVVIAGGEWELCGDTYYRGQCVTLGPGKYPSLKNYGLTHGVSSVRRAPGSPHR